MKEKILDYIKKNWKNLILVLVYIVIASLVYGLWFDSLWHLWFVNLIIIIVIVIIGLIIGYFYIKGENNKIEDEKKQ